MKNIFKSLMLVAVAAMGFTACEQTNVENATPAVPEVAMTITADVDETRTYIDETNKIVKWSEGDQLMVIENDGTFRKTTETVIDGEGKAQFAVSFPKKAGAVTYNAIYPASAVDVNHSSAEEVVVQVKNTQFATATSFDPTADVLVAKQIEFEAQPTELNMQFKRLVSFGKMTLSGLFDDSLIKQVIFTAGDEDVLAGRNLVNATTGEVSEYGVSDDTNTITVNYAENTDTDAVYFACNPFEMTAGETFTVKVICNNAVYTRKVEIPVGRSLKFTEGNLSTFTVDLTNCGEKVEAVTTITDTLTKSFIGITGTAYTNWSSKRGESDAMYAGQSSAGTDIQLRATNPSGIITTATGGNVRKITVQWHNNTTAGRTLDIYGKNEAYTSPSQLYKAAEQGTKLGSIKKGTSTELVIEGDYAYIGMRSNSGAMYITEIKVEWQSGGGSGENVDVVVPSFDLDKRQLSFGVEGGAQEIEVVALNGFNNIVSAETDADWLTITNEDYKFTVTAKENEGFARTANVVFSADGCEDIKVTVSQNANLDAAKETTVAEFLAAEEDDTTLYRLRGTITSVVEETFGNFDITDETGTVYIYGLCSSEGATKYWKDSGAQLGDDIELITVRASYNNKAQGKNAIFVEKRPGTIAFWSFEKTTLTFENTGGEAEIAVSAYNLKETVECEFEDGSMFEAYYEEGVVYVIASENENTEEITDTLYVRSGDLEQKIELTLKKYVDPSDQPVYVEVEAKLSFASTAQRTEFSTSKQVWEQNGIKFTNDKESSTNNIGNYSNPVRLYQNSKVTVEAPGNIKTITVDCTGLDNKYITPWGGTATNKIVTITLDGTSNTYTISKLSAQARAYSITVTYLKENN